VPEVALAFYHILRAGGFTTGGLNFDAKIRRQSLDPADLLYAHIGGMDVCARALLAAAAMIEDGSLARHLEQRYASWDGEEGQAVLDGARSLDELAARVERLGREPQPVSGRQEYLENLVNRFV
jgi:xylose isomerase